MTPLETAFEDDSEIMILISFSGWADVKILLFLYHQILCISKTSDYWARGKKKKKNLPLQSDYQFTP